MSGATNPTPLPIAAAISPNLDNNIQYPELNVVAAGVTPLTVDNAVVISDATAGAQTLTLPTAVGVEGMFFDFKKVDGTINTVTVLPFGAETIDGAASLVLSTLNQSTRIVSDGTNWKVMTFPVSTDIFAATRIVSLIAGDGTDLTIAAAIAALPAEGGLIYIKQGTYPIAVSLAPTNKPIVFAGSGNGTVIDLGANAIPAFTIGFDQPYTFMNLQILGAAPVGQTAFEFAIGASSVQKVTLDTVLVSNIEKTFVVPGTDFPLVYTVNCSFDVANLASSFHWTGSGEWHGVNTICSFTGGTHRGGFAAGAGLGPDLYLANCEVNVTNGGAVNFVQVDRCKFLNGTLTFQGGGTSNGSLIGDSLFDSVAAIARFIDLPAGADSIVINSCVFGAVTAEQIRIASTGCIVTGNSGVVVTETGAANGNHYEEIGPTSTIIGTTSRIENENTQSSAINVTLNETHRTVLIDASGAARTVTLPTAASAKWRKYTIKKTDATVNTCTIDANAAETIDGALTFVLTVQYQALEIQSDGTTWWVI